MGPLQTGSPRKHSLAHSHRKKTIWRRKAAAAFNVFFLSSVNRVYGWTRLRFTECCTGSRTDSLEQPLQGHEIGNLERKESLYDCWSVVFKEY
jgi:hypothetical protein